jgi:hypothetical protein
LRYRGDTFTIWLHGREKLDDFHRHLNSIHNNIQITVEAETDGHTLFLDINVYRRPDGSSGHKSVQEVHTHTNLYLNATSYRPPSKQAVLSTLHRLSVILTVFHKNLSPCMKPSGMVTANDRFSVLSIHLHEPHHHVERIILQWHSYPSSVPPSTTSAGCYPNISRQCVSCQESSPVFFSPSKTTWS